MAKGFYRVKPVNQIPRGGCHRMNGLLEWFSISCYIEADIESP